MTTNQITQIDLAECPTCKIKVSAKRLQKHIQKAHSPEANAAREKRLRDEKQKQDEEKKLAKKRATLKKNIKALEQAKRQYLEVKVQCSSCEKMLPLHSLKSHFMDAHRTDMTQDMQVLHKLSSNDYMFQTPDVREAFALRSSGLTATTTKQSAPKAPQNAQSPNKFSSARQRENFWRDQQGIERTSSEDLFDRTTVLSGGAYGLGKSRKH